MLTTLQAALTGFTPFEIFWSGIVMVGGAFALIIAIADWMQRREMDARFERVWRARAK